MGLAAGYHAAKAGYQVEVIEASSDAGGMAAHFDFAGMSIERFYHFVCKTDQPTFDLMAEIGLCDAMRWRDTSMGYFSGGALHKWGDPVSLLTYPHLSLIEKFRYGLLAFVSTKRDRWDALETQSARKWITRWSGKSVYDKLWKPLFDLKFFQYADNVSAAWIWTRVKRTGRSRKSIFQEQLGYIEGGSQTLVDRLVDRIEALGGAVALGNPVSKVVSESGKVTGVEASDGFHPADYVISTVPTPLVSDMIPDMPPEWKAKYDAIENIGVCCLLFRLKKSVTPHFWVNIIEPDIEIPGIIEFSNLRPVPGGETVVYVPYYMPVTHPKFEWDDQRLIDEAFSYLQRINPAMTRDDMVATKVGRLRHAQPICEMGFAAKIPPVQTPIAGLQVADTCFYYPEDRGVSESARLAKEMVARIIEQKEVT
jgi:protoporphyrinogen oxidase